MTGQIENKIQEIRLSEGLTQETLANAVGVTRQTIIAIERGNYIPSVFLALKIANFFGQTVESIFIINSDK